MEKIYSEASEKSGTHNTNSPCISVEAWKPSGDELSLPSIIILKEGKINESGGWIFKSQEFIVDEYHYNDAKVVRLAIKEYDKYKAKVFKDE